MKPPILLFLIANIPKIISASDSCYNGTESKIRLKSWFNNASKCVVKSNNTFCGKTTVLKNTDADVVVVS